MEITHVANPVKVQALPITAITHDTDTGEMVAVVDSMLGRVILTAEMIARYIPVVGDYVVTQEDGYVYVNPKAVFERKYSPI